MNGTTDPAREFLSHSPDETWALAASLVADRCPGTTLALHGDLGSGKTCFVQGLAAALDIVQPITSPTFTLVNEYQGLLPLYHMDLYRLRGPDDVLALGFEEYIEGDGITAIEWAERAGDLLPPHTIHITFEMLPNPEHRRLLVGQVLGSGCPHPRGSSRHDSGPVWVAALPP